MAMVDAGGSGLTGGLMVEVGWLGLMIGGHPAPSLYSPNELDEL